MKITILLLFSFLYFYALELNKEYTYDDNIIYSDTFINNNRKTALFEIPKNVYTYKVSSKKITLLLSKLDIKATSKYSKITFNKRIKYDKESIVSNIYDKLIKKYRSIQIKSIQIKPISFINLDGYTVKNVIFTNQNIKKSTGTFFVYFSNGKRDKKIYFRYIIDAKVKVIKSRYKIPKNSIINKNNSIEESIKFVAFYHNPLGSNIYNNTMSKSYIKKGAILDENYIKKIPLVIKNRTINAFYTDGGIEISFSAIALESGGLGDYISIIKTDGEKMKAVIISKARVEIR